MNKCIRQASICAAALALGTSLHAQDKFIGSTFEAASIRTDTWYKAFADNFNQITPYKQGKWAQVEATRGSFNWSELDAMYDFAAKNNLLVKQHNLIWGKQQPAWLSGITSAADMQKAIRDWMAAFVNRYGTRTWAYEVVNEPVWFSPFPYRNFIGGDKDWAWVVWCYEQMREIAPGARLLTNEICVENDPNMRRSYISLIQTLQAKNLVDGVCLEAHGLESTDTSSLRSALDEIAALNLPMYISELDLFIANDNDQLAQYKRIIPLLANYPAIKGITFWGCIGTSGTACLIRADGSERPAMTWIRQYLQLPNGPATTASAGSFQRVDCISAFKAVFAPADRCVQLLLPPSAIDAGRKVCVYAADGRLVKAINATRGIAEWGFDSNAGGKVSPGAYYAVIKGENGIMSTPIHVAQ